ncbi:MAG: bifunctional [glutamate--ammonia ligase]-adenylyl-L-tyrosine phosphorylase/[glutamate--ammonia-ligase] adenylyltransferase [Pseudomonadales bacterium]|nr:bifunctional [glutamate--ammonia ligase]-adenylyl-L-tyrosine phosphorylase/[glutamate--ammonia-ligase] adenylyltransferase [Pseudomonadales bacterium]
MQELQQQIERVSTVLESLLEGSQQSVLKDKLVGSQLYTEIVTVCALSDFFYNYIQSIERFSELLHSGDLLIEYKCHNLIIKITQADSAELLPEDVFDARLRQIRQREMARIVFRDLTRRASLEQTTADLSLLADSCIEAAVAFHSKKNELRFGRPRSVSGELQRLCVLALGKLGAVELNVSSDIDLIFLYGESGQVDGDSGLSNQEFFIRLAQQVIKSLDARLATGMVFRVDMRLRPYGESGALILNRNATEKYYLEQGRDWERYAFIKARAAAGDTALGKDFLSWLKPFIYRRHLDYGAVQSLRDMKLLIDKEVLQKQLENDIKMGPGGIREIEFVVQMQQLVWGGNKPKLQQRRLFSALQALVEAGFLPELDGAALRDAYIFLRNTEHVIQAEKDQQTQELPATPLAEQRLAHGMGFDSYASYLQTLDQYRNQVSHCFASIVDSNSGPSSTLSGSQLIWLDLWRELDSSAAAEHLAQNGFVDTDRIICLLAAFKLAIEDSQQIALDRFNQLLPILLSLCAQQASADDSLDRLLPILYAIVRRSTYAAYLLENRAAMLRLVQLCSLSPWVAARIAEYPVLMYELSEQETQPAKFNSTALRAEIDEQLIQYDDNDLEGKMDALRRFKHGVVLRVASLELLDLIPLMQASDNLSMLAEIILDIATELAFEYLIGRHGEPCDRHGQKQGRCFVVVAYGKLGGLELAYGSDLDVVFMHDADIQGQTSGKKIVPNNVFFSRLGQRIVHILSSFTRFGGLYEVDLRLRPDGNKGPLVGTFNAFERYLGKSAWTWEIQALVRARFVAGNRSFAARFSEFRARILASKRDKPGLKQDVAGMRLKMREAQLARLSRSKQDGGAVLDGANQDRVKQDRGQQNSARQAIISRVQALDLKQDVGGMIDIEFLVQYLILTHCSDHPGLSDRTDNISQIEALAAQAILPEAAAEILIEAYVAFRSAGHYFWLGGKIDSVELLNQLALHQQNVVKIYQHYLSIDGQHG